MLGFTAEFAKGDVPMRYCSNWMKVVLSIAALAGAVVAPAWAQTPPAGPPAPTPADRGEVPIQIPLEQVSPLLDLGYGTPMAFLSGTVTLMNNSEAPLTITSVRGECSCTDATVLGTADNTKTLQPGEAVDILIAVEFPKEIGTYTKQVFVFTNLAEHAHQVPVVFEVGYPIRVNGGARRAIVVKRTGTTRLDSIDEVPFRVISVHGAEPEFEDFDPATDELKSSYRVQHDWSKLSASELPRWMVIETDHPNAEMVAIPAMVPGYQPVLDKTTWRPLDEHVLLGSMAAGKPKVIPLVFTGKAVIPGQKIAVRSSNPDLILRVVGARKPDRGGGLHMDIEVKTRPEARGFIAAVVTFEYDGAINSLDVFARAVDPAMMPGSSAH